MSAPPEPAPAGSVDPVTERLPVVPPVADPVTGLPPTAAGSGCTGPEVEPETGPIPVVPVPRPAQPPAPAAGAHGPGGPSVPGAPVPAAPVPGSSAPGAAAASLGSPVVLWAVAGVAGLLALGLLVDVITEMSIYGGDSGSGMVFLLQLPVLLLAAGWACLAAVVATARPTAPWSAAVLAACTVVTGLDTVDGPGLLTCLGALAVAGVLAASSTVRGALTATLGSAPPVLVAVRTGAVWTVVASLVGMLATFAWAGDGDTGLLVASGVLFLLLAGGAACVAVLLSRLVAPGAPTVLVARSRIAAAACVPVGLIAAVLADAGAVALLVVVPALVAPVVALWVPTGVRAFVGDAPLEPVRRMQDTLAARSAATGHAPRSTPEAAARVAYDALPAPVRSAPLAYRVIAGALAAVVVVVLVVIMSSSTNAAAIGTLTVVVGLVAAAAAFTPTMPPLWRALCGAGAVLSIWIGIDGAIGYSVRSDYVWLVGLAPIALVGYVAIGFHANRRDGVTSAAPGWVADRPRVAPPGPSLSFVPPVTAKGRSQIRLETASVLEPATVLAVVRRCTAVRGNWFVVGGDHVSLAGESDGAVGLLIGGGHAAFRAQVRADGTGTRLTVGGLDRWTQSRSYYAGFIPAGPAHVQGYWMYTLFLQTVASEMRACDPHSSSSIVT